MLGLVIMIWLQRDWWIGRKSTVVDQANQNILLRDKNKQSSTRRRIGDIMLMPMTTWSVLSMSIGAADSRGRNDHDNMHCGRNIRWGLHWRILTVLQEIKRYSWTLRNYSLLLKNPQGVYWISGIFSWRPHWQWRVIDWVTLSRLCFIIVTFANNLMTFSHLAENISPAWDVPRNTSRLNFIAWFFLYWL